MENASEALIMAASVIIFVVALSVSVYAFGEARIAADIVMQGSDTTYDQTYIDADTSLLKRVSIDGVQNQDTQVTRTVSAETIIPTLYRAYKENLVIVFLQGSGNGPFTNGIFAQKKSDGSGWNKDVDGLTLDNKKIDFVKLNIGSEARATEFITYLLKSKKDSGDLLQTKFMVGGTQNYKSLMDTPLYDVINNNKFNELIGTYYMEDVEGYTNSEFTNLYNSGNMKEPKISDANKTKRRVITYILNNN